MTIAAMTASQKRVTNGSLLTVVGGVFGVAMLFSGAALLAGTASGEGGVEQVSVALAAPKGAANTGFDLKTLTAPADTPFTIAFNNQDPGVPHDVVVASADPAKDPAAETFLDGEVIAARAPSTTRCRPCPRPSTTISARSTRPRCTAS